MRGTLIRLIMNCRITKTTKYNRSEADGYESDEKEYNPHNEHTYNPPDYQTFKSNVKYGDATIVLNFWRIDTQRYRVLFLPFAFSHKIFHQHAHGCHDLVTMT